MTGAGSLRPAGGSLLVIDNDEGLLELLSFVFKGQGFTVFTARQGTAGIALARAHRPSVIVCDIIMDDVHGFEVLRRFALARPPDDPAEHPDELGTGLASVSQRRMPEVGHPREETDDAPAATLSSS
jgi:CheY-like chemotaxis protein